MTLKYGPTFLMDKLRLSWHFVAASAAKQERLSFPNRHAGVCWTTHASWRAPIHLNIPAGSAYRPVKTFKGKMGA